VLGRRRVFRSAIEGARYGVERGRASLDSRTVGSG